MKVRKQEGHPNLTPRGVCCLVKSMGICDDMAEGVWKYPLRELQTDCTAASRVKGAPSSVQHEQKSQRPEFHPYFLKSP